MARKSRARAGHAGDWKRPFLRALSSEPVVWVACEKAGVSRSVAYLTRKQDDAFRREWDDALENGLDSLEVELHRRGRKNSDRAAMFLLAHRRPEVFGDASQETNLSMETADVMVLFQSLVTAVRHNVSDTYQLGRIEREFVQLIADGPLQLDGEVT